MDKPVFVITVGLPASGKSTYANKLAEEINATIFSSDKLREELFGDVNEQAKNVKLFQELHKRIKDCLKSGKSAIMDSTSISSKRRRSFLEELNKIDCYKQCIVMATPYEQCLENNAMRDRKVPVEVIDRMYRSWNTPYWFEGWDAIEIIYWDNSEGKEYFPIWLGDYANYDQDNPHHTMTLAEHCLKAGKILSKSERTNYELSYAGYIHDCGKPFTKTFTNSKGEKTDVAHYYSHENVGAYDSLFFGIYPVNALDVSILVNLHMTPYYWERDNNEKLHKKYKKLWGEELYNDVMKLHEADKTAH